ncbi:hypothetical protein SS50377_23191 [Spironucleus salmonicida]|uniref:Uncharacterized protein n=1 Tax=Spironucleus salmonicida TaxID=348837 RepID=V6LNP3_9EUKA|nr:hypothetical protein SS50377_23191 [Spironucleus salmonicida]|eukprot:EST46292.1 Hypothetical protein SS50377_13678 [Spironucleus salmonicida]
MRSCSPTSKISNKLQQLTQYNQQMPNIKQQDLVDLIHVHQQNQFPEDEVPPSKLPYKLKVSKFPTNKPISKEERGWLLQLVQQELVKTLNQHSALELASQIQFELARHMQNAFKIPIFQHNQNPFSELIFIQKKLSDFIADISSNSLIDNIDQYSETLRSNNQDNKIFIMETQQKQLQIEYDSLKTTYQIEQQKISTIEFQVQEMRKQRDDKHEINTRLVDKIKKMQNEIEEKQLQIEELKLQKNSNIIVNDVVSSNKIQLLPRPHSVNTSKILKNTGSLFDSKMKNKQLLVQQDILLPHNYTREDSLKYSQFQVKVDENISSISNHLNTTLVNSTTQKQIHDKTHLVNQFEAEIDMIPTQQVMKYNPKYKTQVPETIGYSRVEQAEIMMSDGLKVEEVESLFDPQFPDNYISCNYNNADIINFRDTEFNPITREITSIKKRIIPDNVNEQNIIFSSQKLVEGIIDQAEDDSYNLETKVINLIQQENNTNKTFDQFFSYTKDQFQFQQLKLTIQQHRNSLSHYTMPILLDDSLLINTDYQIKYQTHSPLLKQIQCIQLQNSAVQAILGTTSSGGIIGLYSATENDIQDSINQIKTSFIAPGGVSYSNSIFGANFATAQKNPFSSQQQINQDWNIIKGAVKENIDTLQEIRDIKVTKFFMDFLKKSKEPPHIMNLLLFYVKQYLASKAVSYNLCGLKNKPSCQLMKILGPVPIQDLISCITGQDFDKLINEGVVKINQKIYKEFQNISSSKNQAIFLEAINKLNFVNSEEIFGLQAIKKCLKQNKLTLYNYQQLLQQVDLIFTSRFAFQSRIKDHSVYQRGYIEFVQFLYTFILEQNNYIKEQADKVIVSLSYSSLVYIAYLNINEEKEKRNYIHYDNEKDKLSFSSTCSACNSQLLVIFHQILNDQFQEQDIEFIIFVYNVIRNISSYSSIINFSFIKQEVAEVAITKIFQQLQVAGISGFMKTVVDDVLQQLYKVVIKINDENIIVDIGKVIFLCLKCKEQLCSHFISTTVYKFEKLDNIKLEDYIRIMMTLVPKLSPQYPPMLDMFKSIYISYLIKNGNISIKNMLTNPDLYISQNITNFELKIYDYYSEFIPVLKLNRLFYSLSDISLVPINKQYELSIQELTPKIELAVKIISQSFVSNGLGLSPIFEPFIIPSAFNACDFRLGANPDTELTFLDQQRPLSLMIGKSVTLLFLGFKQAATQDQLHSINFLQQMLTMILRGLSTLRVYQTFNPKQHEKRIQLISFYSNLIQQVGDFIMQNTYIDELKSAIGVDFDESIINDVDRLMMLSRNFLLQWKK